MLTCTSRDIKDSQMASRQTPLKQKSTDVGGEKGKSKKIHFSDGEVSDCDSLDEVNTVNYDKAR